MVKIVIDLYKVGYVAGRTTAFVGLSVARAKLVISGYKQVAKVAKVHKIDSSNPSVVTKNVFDCLQYLD